MIEKITILSILLAAVGCQQHDVRTMPELRTAQVLIVRELPRFGSRPKLIGVSLDVGPKGFLSEGSRRVGLQDLRKNTRSARETGWPLVYAVDTTVTLPLSIKDLSIALLMIQESLVDNDGIVPATIYVVLEDTDRQSP